MAERDITVRGETRPSGREEVRAPENYIRPAVDICETEQNLILMADMPGVDKENLDVNMEQGILTIKGKIAAAPRGEPLSREFSLADYYRQFELPNEIESEKTEAEFNYGVLTLTMPKSETARPRRIEIRH